MFKKSIILDELEKYCDMVQESDRRILKEAIKVVAGIKKEDAISNTKVMSCQKTLNGGFITESFNEILSLDELERSLHKTGVYNSYRIEERYSDYVIINQETKEEVRVEYNQIVSVMKWLLDDEETKLAVKVGNDICYKASGVAIRGTIKCTKAVTQYRTIENASVKVGYYSTYNGYDKDTKLHRIYVEGSMGSVTRKECWLTNFQLISQFEISLVGGDGNVFQIGTKKH